MSADEKEPGVGVDHDIRLDELLPWLEFGCWTAIALFPLLYWVNGPAVSPDQFVVRTILVVVAVTGAVGLRIYHWRFAQKPAEPSSNNNADTAREAASESTEPPS